MSTNYYAATVLGAFVDATKLGRTVAAFRHDFPRDYTIDPRTGRELWARQSGVSVLEEIDFGPDPLVEVCEVGYDSDKAVVGMVLCRCQGEEGPQSGRSSLSPERVAAAAGPLLERLRKAGLEFSDADFGLHVVMRVSP